MSKQEPDTIFTCGTFRSCRWLSLFSPKALTWSRLFWLLLVAFLQSSKHRLLQEAQRWYYGGMAPSSRNPNLGQVIEYIAGTCDL